MPEWGMSAYLSEYENRGVLPSGEAGTPVFLSLHRPEEYDAHYNERMLAFIRLLKEQGHTVIADIDNTTLARFHAADCHQLCEITGADSVRLDYGFTLDEVISAARMVPTVINASTLTEEDGKRIREAGVHVTAMHNYYPRPETGLDRDYLLTMNDFLHAYGISAAAFVPGDGIKRGPLYEGLPTLEEHRYLPPSYGALDLFIRCHCDAVYTGDPQISRKEQRRMERYLKEGIIEVPCDLYEDAAYLYGQVFTNRIDAPAWMIRCQESRAMSPANIPGEPLARNRGCLTMDNDKYLRYRGEIQILKKDFPPDEKVNVIGHVREAYAGMIDLVGRGMKLMLVKE